MNCAAGVSRSNTVFLCYLALFGFGDDENMFNYKDNNLHIEELARFLKTHYPLAMPNLNIVKRVVQENQAYIDELRRKALEEEARRRREQEERERLAALKKSQEESEYIRLKRLAEAEAEKLRLQRL